MDKKEEILTSVFYLFSIHGYSFSMSNIATQVNLKAPSIYSHFSGKEEMLKIVSNREISEYCTYLDSLYIICEKDVCVESGLKRVFLAIVKYFSSDNRLEFWNNMLVVDQDNLRKEVSGKIYELELYHLSKLKLILSQDAKIAKKFNNDMEGSALLFLAMIQGTLQGLIISHGTIIDVEKYMNKVWKAYWRTVHCC